MAGIAQLKALVGLDASAYKAGAGQVIGANANMRGSMAQARGGFRDFSKGANAGQASMLALHNASGAASAAMRGDVVTSARLAATALASVGRALIVNPALLALAALAAAIGAVIHVGRELGKMDIGVGQRFENSIRRRQKEIAGGDRGVKAREGEAESDRRMRAAGDVEGMRAMIGVAEGERDKALADARKVNGFDEKAVEASREKIIAAETEVVKRREMYRQTVEAARKAEEDLAEMQAKREGREAAYYRQRAAEARKLNTTVKRLEAEQYEERAKEAEARQTEPIKREIERLREQGQSLNATTKGRELQTDSLAKVGGFFAGGRAGFSVESKSLRVQEESRKLLAEIAKKQDELVEIERLNRGDL